MDKLIYKHSQLLQALSSMGKAIATLQDLESRGHTFNPKVDYEEQYKTARDSLIQRFEYSIDLLWKYLKTYLEEAHVPLELKIPGEVVRQAFSLAILSEQEAEQMLRIIKSRNITLHVYVDEIAEQLADEIPKYFPTLRPIVDRLKPPISLKSGVGKSQV